MHISQNLSQRMEQKLVMTRQMIQSIEMLQLPLMDLMQNINQELVENPCIELKEVDVVKDPDPDAPQNAAVKEIIREEKETEAHKAKEPANETEARIKRLES